MLSPFEGRRDVRKERRGPIRGPHITRCAYYVVMTLPFPPNAIRPTVYLPTNQPTKRATAANRVADGVRHRYHTILVCCSSGKLMSSLLEHEKWHHKELFAKAVGRPLFSPYVLLVAQLLFLFSEGAYEGNSLCLPPAASRRVSRPLRGAVSCAETETGSPRHPYRKSVVQGFSEIR